MQWLPIFVCRPRPGPERVSKIPGLESRSVWTMFSRAYLPEHTGSMTISPAGPFAAGTYQSLTLVYTAGSFGIDDTGHVRITWRATSDMGKPQFTDPSAPNYTTVKASNGAALQCGIERSQTRPW